jgi:hypothetical protein
MRPSAPHGNTGATGGALTARETFETLTLKV